MVRLNPEEFAFCTSIGQRRYEFDLARGVKTQKMDPNLSDLEVDIIGARGEGAICKCLNAKQSEDVSYEGMTKWDVEWVAGMLIECKTLDKLYDESRAYLHGKKILNTKAVAYILAIPHRPNLFRIGGWITKAEFKRVHIMKDFNYGKEPALVETKLHPIEELLVRDRRGKYIELWTEEIGVWAKDEKTLLSKERTPSPVGANPKGHPVGRE